MGSGTAGKRLQAACDDRPVASGSADALCWPDMTFDRRRVRALAVPAQRWTDDGSLWEYEDGAFYVTVLGAGRERRLVEDETLAPPDGWVHPPDCTCEACRIDAV